MLGMGLLDDLDEQAARAVPDVWPLAIDKDTLKNKRAAETERVRMVEGNDEQARAFFDECIAGKATT